MSEWLGTGLQNRSHQFESGWHLKSTSNWKCFFIMSFRECLDLNDFSTNRDFGGIFQDSGGSICVSRTPVGLCDRMNLWESTRRIVCDEIKIPILFINV